MGRYLGIYIYIFVMSLWSWENIRFTIRTRLRDKATENGCAKTNIPIFKMGREGAFKTAPSSNCAEGREMRLENLLPRL